MSNDSAWKGASISHIQGSQSPWGAPEFPLVQPAYDHTVLYHIPSNGAVLDRPPKPQIGKDKWDHRHVRLPCSTHSLYPIENDAGETSLTSRWEMIQSALSKPIHNSRELACAILSYNTQFKNKWKFRSLHKLFNDYLEEEETKYFFDVTLPDIARLALALPKLIQSPIPLLEQNKNKSLSLSQQQAACLLANAFFCTFPRRNTTKKTSEYASYPHINFNGLYECSPNDNIMEKLKCICHYFRRVCTKMPAGVVTVRRRAARAGGWRQCARALAALPVHVDAARTIEDADGLLQVDFANKFLGGGVLGHGCVQEEIRFMICPELLITMLVTEVMKSDEAVIVIGCERYSKYTGYASSFQWAGDHIDRTPFDSSGRRRCAVLAIDAIAYVSRDHEFKETSINRELNKAWVGFSMYTEEEIGADSEVALQYPGVATGNWGCGVFGGSPDLKWLIQGMAAVRAGRPLAYYTFGDTILRDSIIRVYEMLAKHNCTVGQLYELILSYSKTDVNKTSLNSFLEHTLKGQQSKSHCNGEDTLEVNVDQEEISTCVQLLLNDSPDMFSQDEETSEKSAKITENTYVCQDNSAECKITIENTETADQPVNTLRLFKEMEKLDNESGGLNLNSPQKSIFNQSGSSSNVTESNNKLHMDISPEVKKKITKKITDYFSKKPL